MLKLYINEEGATAVRAVVADSEMLATCRLAYVEARAGFARRRRAGELTPSEQRRLVEEFELDWDRYVKVEISESLVIEAAHFAERHRLRAYDALHLASALALRLHTGVAPMFACWDADLNAAAAREGLPLLPSR